MKEKSLKWKSNLEKLHLGNLLCALFSVTEPVRIACDLKPNFSSNSLPLNICSTSSER